MEFRHRGHAIQIRYSNSENMYEEELATVWNELNILSDTRCNA